MNRSTVRLMRVAQRNRCAICGGTLAPDDANPRRGIAASVDHVFPVSRYQTVRGFRPNQGNIIISHRRCNNAKSDRDPTGCEIIWLHAVNAHMGWDMRRLRRIEG